MTRHLQEGKYLPGGGVKGGVVDGVCIHRDVKNDVICCFTHKNKQTKLSFYK